MSGHASGREYYGGIEITSALIHNGFSETLCASIVNTTLEVLVAPSVSELTNEASFNGSRHHGLVLVPLRKNAFPNCVVVAPWFLF